MVILRSDAEATVDSRSYVAQLVEQCPLAVEQHALAVE
jgi:hypothetical protein